MKRWRYYDKVVAYRPDSEGACISAKPSSCCEWIVWTTLLICTTKQHALAGKFAMTLNALGYTLADRTDRYDEAAKLIEKALEMDPGSAAIIDSWGWVLLPAGQE